MRIVCISHRDWALGIYDQIARRTDHITLIIRSKAQFSEDALRDFKPDLLLFYGWSWRVGETILSMAPCVMLHPAPLPRYRGGSPLQNQIIAGETMSAVTLFVMNGGMDTGDILAQRDLSLAGDLNEILARITTIGIELTLEILRQWPIPRPQDPGAATYCVRRKPEQSEITMDELSSKPGIYLYNKIRMLEDPYPNAFIRTHDGRRLLIKAAVLAEDD